jgi:hypothetical protein
MARGYASQACRVPRRSRPARGEPEALEDLAGHVGVLDRSEKAHLLAALRAAKRIDLEDTLEELGPRELAAAVGIGSHLWVLAGVAPFLQSPRSQMGPSW